MLQWKLFILFLSFIMIVFVRASDDDGEDYELT